MTIRLYRKDHTESSLGITKKICHIRERLIIHVKWHYVKIFYRYLIVALLYMYCMLFKQFESVADTTSISSPFTNYLIAYNQYYHQMMLINPPGHFNIIIHTGILVCHIISITKIICIEYTYLLDIGYAILSLPLSCVMIIPNHGCFIAYTV